MAPANLITLEENFREQNAFVLDPARFVDAQCSRRAGKSNGLGLRYLKTFERHPKGNQLYLGMTMDSAREIMWPVMQELDEKHKVGCKFIESKLEVVHPGGGKLKLMGADLKNFIKRLRGRKYTGVGVDEAQDFGSHLQSLIDDVLTPSIADYEDGWLALTGTPGAVPTGYFFDVTHNGKFGFSHHGWTLLENPFMPNPQAFIADLMKRREWKDDHPTLLREYRNKWILDIESLWIRYNEKINHYDKLPAGHEWNHILGIDIGYNDADAIAVLAWSETCAETYLVEELVTPKQGITALTKQIEDIERVYKPHKIVMDEGGLGKKIAEDLRLRYAVPIEPADKAQKQSNVEFLNDHLRLGKFKAKKDSRFAKDSYLVQIDWDKTTPNRIIVKKKPHSDIIDGVLYAFRESYAYTFKHKQNKPEIGSKEWAKSQENEMFEAELEGLMKEQEYMKWVQNGS